MSRVLIIGGGAIGLSLAWHLGRRGADDVTVLERNQLTSGTSWHAAGIVGPLRATPNMTRLAMAALEVFPQLEAETGMSTGYVRTGGYWFARETARLDELHRIADLGTTQGLTPRMIRPDEVPLAQLNLSNHTGALHVSEDANVNPVDLCMAYARAARDRGVTIREGVRVARLLKHGNLMPPDLDRVEHIIMAAMERIPALETGGVKSVINGPITFTPDANPLIGPAHGPRNAWLLTGSSMGVMEGGGAGRFLAHWMTHGAPPMDALAVDSRRFGSWADREYRVAKAVECFGLQFGVHYPHEERPAGRGLRLSPLHDLMVARGAVMGAAHGWERPNWFADTTETTADETFRRANWFTPVASEVDAATTRVALADLSVFSKFEVAGPDVGAFLLALGANHPPRPGRIGLTHALTPAGGVLSEFTVARISKNRASLNSAAAAEEIDFDLLSGVAASFDVHLSNVTETFAVIGVMGPYAPEVLSDLADMPWLTIRDATVTDVPVRAWRMSYIGECGWELHVAAGLAAPLFMALEQAAQPFGLGLYGAYAANSMRLEKGYRGWGSDLTTERSPLEAGLAPFVRPDLRDDLIREAPWDMVLLEIAAAEVDPFYGHTLWQDGRPVGIVTSGAYGHRTGRVLALAYLRDTSARDNLTVSILGQHRRATILQEPPFDPQNARLKTGGFI